MSTFYLRSLLWLAVATSFLLSCSKAENDEIKPINTKNTNASARIGSVLYEQVQSAELYNSRVVIGSGPFANVFDVPAGETWNIEQFIFYNQIGSASTSLYNVNIYADDQGEPGELLTSSLNRQAEIIDQLSGEFSFLIVSVSQIDIEDIQLTAGKYWIGLSSADGSPSNWYIIPPNGIDYAVSFSSNSAWVRLPYTLPFTLLGSVITDLTIEDVISTFNTKVADGTIAGAGKGKTAANNLKAFTNMLNNAKLLLEANNTVGACKQLTDAQKRIHTGGKVRPDHFITGPGAGALYNLIAELKEDLGCQ
jgi:hypothetical protein